MSMHIGTQTSRKVGQTNIELRNIPLTIDSLNYLYETC